MRNLFSILLILGGLALGLYVGLWIFFIGGIVDLINIVQSGNVVALDVAWSIVKIIFASTLGSLAGIIPIVIGVASLDS